MLTGIIITHTSEIYMAWEAVQSLLPITDYLLWYINNGHDPSKPDKLIDYKTLNDVHKLVEGNKITVVYESYNGILDLAAIRNRAIEIAETRLAKTDWLFMLDSDESIEASSEKLGVILEGTPQDEGGKLIMVQGAAIQSDGSMKDYATYICRLFRGCHGYRYKDRVHETIEEDIEKMKHKITIIPTSILKINHRGYETDWGTRKKKINRCIKIMQEELLIKQNRPYLYGLGVLYYRLGLSYEELGDMVMAENMYCYAAVTGEIGKGPMRLINDFLVKAQYQRRK